MRTHTRGYTMTELVVVLAILVLLAAAVFGVMGPMTARARQKKVENAVVAFLGKARTKAITASADAFVLFPAPDQGRCICLVNGVDLGWTETFPTGTSVDNILPSPVAGQPPYGAIVFLPDGSAREDRKPPTILYPEDTGLDGRGNVVSMTGTAFFLRDGSARKLVTVNCARGTVRIEKR